MFVMTRAFSWSISLCPASFRIPRPNLPVTPGVFWLPTFGFQSPIMKSTSFLGVLKGLVGLHRTIQLQLLQSYWSGHRLGLLWYWMFCLGNEQRSFCRFSDCIQVLHFGLFFFLKILILPKLIYRISIIPVKVQGGFFFAGRKFVFALFLLVRFSFWWQKENE